MTVVRMLVALWLAAGWTGMAPGAALAEGPLEIMSLSTADFPYVRLYISARDRSGNPVALQGRDLTVTDSDEQIASGSVQVGGAETTPVALVLLVDASDRDWIEPIGALTGFDFLKRAGSAFLDSFPQGHMLQVVGYDKLQDATIALDGTPAGPKARLQAMPRHPRTWLYDRVDYSLDLLKGANTGRKVLVVVADGNDVDSDITGQADYAGTLAAKARSAGINVFAIGTGPGVRDRLLRSLAEPTGGLFQLSTTEQLDRAFQRVTDSLRLQSVVTYLAPCTGRPHRVIVASTSLGAQAVTQYEPGEAPPQLKLSGRRLSEDVHEVVVEAPQPRCPLKPPGVILDLGAGGALEPDRQEGDRYTFLINARERNLPSGRYLIRGVANNGMEARSAEAYEFDWTCSPPWACGAGAAAPVLGLVVVALSLAGAGFMAKELRRPRAVDAYLEPYYERGGPMVWPEGTQFYLKTSTTIGRTGNADIPIPSRYKNIPGQAVRLSARGKGEDLRFDVKVESEAVHVWIDRRPYSKENATLREGNVLAIEGLSFRLLRREATQAWISAESAAP